MRKHELIELLEAIAYAIFELTGAWDEAESKTAAKNLKRQVRNAQQAISRFKKGGAR